jgi:hypothetical protein
VAKAAEAAATSAARAVEAAKAAEAASRGREANKNEPMGAAADAARAAAEAAEIANSHADSAAEMAAAASEPTAVQPSLSEPGDETEEPQLANVDHSQTAGTDDGITTVESTANPDGENVGDLLGLDSPTSSTPKALARLGFMAALGAAGVFVLSVLAVSLVAKGTVLDVIVLITWLGVAGLAIASVLLLAAAGIIKGIEASRQGRDRSETVTQSG